MRRAIVWSTKPVIGARDIEEALIRRAPTGSSADVMSRPLGSGFDLDRLLEEIQQAYIARALTLANGRKVEAARLLGFRSHQVLSNRMKIERNPGKR